MFEFFKRSTKKDQETPISNIATLVREGDNLLSDTLILLDERLSGNLFCSEQIVVEQNGVLSGNITAKRCVVSGTINGDIVSTDQMEIKSTAVIHGNIKSAAINIEPGAVINGKVIIAEDNRAAARLMDRINNHSADEYLNAKLAAEQIELPVAVSELQDKPVNIKHEEIHQATIVEKPFVLTAPKSEEAAVIAAPQEPIAVHPFVQQIPLNQKAEELPAQAITQKPLVAPTPKADNKPAEEGSNRWW